MMSHLDTTLTINIDSMLKNYLKDEAEEEGTTLSALVRRYIIRGFDDTTMGKEYWCSWEKRNKKEQEGQN